METSELLRWEGELRETFNRLGKRSTTSSAFKSLSRSIDQLTEQTLPIFISCTLQDPSLEPVYQRQAVIKLLPLLAAAHRYELAPALGRIIAFLVKRLKECESLLEQPVIDAFSALARYVSISEDDGHFAKYMRPLIQLLLQQHARHQKSTALCIATVIRTVSITTIKSHGVKVAQRLVDAEPAIPDGAKDAWLSCLIAVAECAGDAILTHLPIIVHMMTAVLECIDPRARVAAADGLVTLAKTFGEAIRPFIETTLQILEDHRYDNAKLARAAIVRAIHHFEFLAAGGDSSKYKTASSADLSMPSTPKASMSSRSTYSTPKSRSQPQRLRPASTSKARKTVSKRSSLFARKPNTAFFAEAHSPTSVGANPPRSPSPDMTVRDLSDPDAQRRAEEQFAASLRPSLSQDSSRVPSAAASFSKRPKVNKKVDTKKDQNAELIKVLQQQQAGMLDALDKFSTKVSAVLQSMNDRLMDLENRLDERELAEAPAPTASDVAKMQVLAATKKKSFDTVDDVSAAQQEAARQTLIACAQADTDETLMALISDIVEADALLALSRVSVATLDSLADEDGDGKSDFGNLTLEWKDWSPLDVVRAVLERIAAAAARISGANSDLAACGVRWCKAALSVALPDVDESDVVAGFHKRLGIWSQCQHGASFDSVVTALETISARPGTAGFQAARILNVMEGAY